MNADETVLDHLTERIIGSALTVSNALVPCVTDSAAISRPACGTLPRSQADAEQAQYEPLGALAPVRREFCPLARGLIPALGRPATRRTAERMRGAPGLRCITSASPGRLRCGASQVRQHVRNHLSAAPRRKNFTADEARRCTPMHADGAVLNDLSGQVIGCAFTVLDTPGAGFLEKVHEDASAFAVPAAGLSVVQQCAARVYYWNVVVGDDFVDLRVEDALPVELNTVKALDDARMPRLLDPGVGCHAPMTARRPARSSARWLISPSRAWRPNAWRTTGEPHGPIGVHRRASPCFICGKFLLVLPRHQRATRAEAAGDRSLSEPRPACAQPVRITVQGYRSSASPILWRRRDLLATLSGTIDGA